MNSISKYMTDEEILSSYKNAIVQKEQVKILCDLALVPKKTLVEFLYSKGVLSEYAIGAYARNGLLPPECSANKKAKTEPKAVKAEPEKPTRKEAKSEPETVKQEAVQNEQETVQNEPKTEVTTAPMNGVSVSAKAVKTVKIPNAVKELALTWLDENKTAYECAAKIIAEYEEIARFIKETDNYD